MNERAKAGRGAHSAATAGTTLLKSACERLPIGFALFDASFRLAAWNAPFAALRGYPRKLLKAGTPLESFVRFDTERGEYGDGTIDALTRTKLAALKRGRPAKREKALPDGRCLRIACERVPEGGLLLTCEDFTDAHRATQRLRESERQLAEQTAEQTATAEILKVISASPTDIQPVLDGIAESAARLCDARDSSIFLVKVDVLDLAADHAEFPIISPGERLPINWGLVVGRSVLGRQLVHVPDLASAEAQAEFPVSAPRQRRYGTRTILAMPMLCKGTAIGVILIRRLEVRPFSDKQISLLKTFADQAVIAIENVRLFNELEARNRELTGALDREKATGEILRVISGSPTDIQPVLDAVAERAGQLCDSPYTNVLLADGDQLRVMSVYSTEPGPKPDRGNFVPISRSYVNGRAVLDREVVHIPDVLPLLDTEFPDIRRNQRKFGFRAVLVVPLIREGRAVGTIFIWRREPGLFADHQVALLKTFADQAVIAIENVRLFNETKEALEQQRATADVLASISGSLTDAQPVFERIVKNVRQLFGTRFAVLQLLRRDMVEMPAVDGDPGFERLRDRYPRPLDDSTVGGLAMLAKKTVQFAPVLDNPATPPATVEFAKDFGFNSVIFTPMIHEGKVIGAIGAAYPEAKGFDERYVALIRSFADQAVIAIENVRLFNELQARNRELTESLEQQTATAEILRVISSSPTDIAPVLGAVAENAARLCEANDVVVMMNEGDVLRAVRSTGPFGERFGANFTIPITRGSAAGRAVVERATVQVADFALESDEEYPVGREHQRIYGNHGAMATPLLRGDAVLGVIAVLRRDVRPFSDRQSALLQTFADQAAIAIANVRLFNETKEALDQIKASAEVLQVISSSVADTKPVFDKILESSERLFEGRNVGICQVGDDGAIHLSAYHGPNREELMRHFPVPLSEASGNGTAILQRRVMHYPDVDAEGVPDYARRGGRIGGNRSALFAPMLWEGRGIGSIFVGRPTVGGFSEKEIALLKTFADQAAIAIQNARLFNETKEALERQTATAEILKVIASSPSDEQPVFDAIVAHAGRIAGGCSVNVSRLIGDELHLAAYTRISPEADDALKRAFPVSVTDVRPLAEAVRRKAPFFVGDFETDPGVSRKARELMRARGFRSTVYVPIRREDLVYGVMHVSKVEPGPFPDHWVNMLRTFADQAVIAIENVRLFNETKEALDHQRASAEVLQVISSSVADTTPVFEKILESCERLFVGKNVGVGLIREDGLIHTVAYHGPHAQPFAVPLTETSGSGSAILQRRVMHYPDVDAPGVPDFARRGSMARGDKALLIAPMLWEARGIGVIFVGRDSVGAFSEKEIALLKTFADQAVIAIQNARLFHEIEDKSRQLEIANQHKSAFLANMSHELRTPLNAVIGFSEMLSARYFGDLTAKQAEYVNDIHGSGKHLLSLINDILDLSKIEAGRMELELGEFDLRDALDNALTLVRERAQRGGVTLRLDADAALGPFVGDERKLKQVMLNLLSNAVKFTPRGGAVSVAAKRVDGTAEIAVSDTGAGIAPEDQEAIFEAFRQVGTDVTRKREGTGLGLALTRRFVELHGGTIRVESSLGEGSTFTVRLPIRHGE